MSNSIPELFNESPMNYSRTWKGKGHEKGSVLQVVTIAVRFDILKCSLLWTCFYEVSKKQTHIR